MINFLRDNALSLISTIFGSGSLFLYFLERKKNNALISQEVSKSDQEKISTADKTIDLLEKLRATMDRQFEEMDKEISSLKRKLNMYVEQCEKCANNKIEK